MPDSNIKKTIFLNPAFRLAGLVSALLLLVMFLGYPSKPILPSRIIDDTIYYATGAVTDLKLYLSVPIAIIPEDDKTKPLPEYVSLEKFAPRRMSQGDQSSCVGWGVSYAARTILEAICSGIDPDSIAMSPSFIFNQIKIGDCRGAYIVAAVKYIRDSGDLSFSKFKYTDQSCQRKPDLSLKQEAEGYKIKAISRFSKSDFDYTTDLKKVKVFLANGRPVIIANNVGGSFKAEMKGKKIWFPTKEDSTMKGFKKHCMCIIGYDEKMEGGAFQIMNSWGSAWGEGGIAWMRYDDFLYYNLEAYAMEPLPDRNCNATNIVKSGGINSNETSGRLEFTIGLLNDDTKQYDPLNKEGEIFSTPMKKGEKKYKVEIDNSGAGYFYVFKQDNGPDMRANVLFPDVVNYSPYFGLSGRRTVPVNQPLMVKSINEPGNHSYYLIIVATQKPIDYNNVCSAIGKNMFFAYVTPFSENVINALSGKLKIAKNVQYQSENGKIKVSADIKDQGDVFMIIKIADMGI